MNAKSTKSAEGSQLTRSSVDRRKLVIGAGATLGAAALGARGLTARTAAQDVTKIDFWTPGGSAPFCDGFQAIGDEYKALVGNVEVESVQCGVGDQSFNEVLLAKIAAGDPPDASILWTSPIALATRGALAPLDEWMATSRNSQVENWPANVLASCQLDGQTFGLPAAAGTYAMVYNEELFEAKGLPSKREEFPKTFDELRRFSKQITEWDGDTLKTAGIIPPRSNVEIPIWVAANGGQFYDAENFKYQLDSEPVVEFFNWALEWLDDEYKGDLNQVNLSGNWSDYVADGVGPAFQGGTLGALATGFWITGEFYNVDPSFERWNAASFPVGPSGTTTASGYWPNWLVVPAKSKHPEAGFGFLDYISVEGMTTWFKNVPDLPTNIKVPPLVPVKTVEKRGQAFADDITAFFRGQLDVATPMWNSPVQDFADDQLARAIEQIYAHQSTPQDVLAQTQKACQAELDRVMASR